MRVLYIGDIMGKPGRNIVCKLLPKIVLNKQIDFVIAQSENVSHGKGMSTHHYSMLEEAGVDGFTGGNHSFERQQNIDMILNPRIPIVAPANVLGQTYGNYKIIKKGKSSIVIVSLLGHTIPNGYKDNVENPLDCIDKLLPKIKEVHKCPILLNFHGDLSSEKVMIGHYLNGKISTVIGDHWHTPTSDERILSAGTAHMTDVGMCGALDSSLGVDWHITVDRWRGKISRNKMHEEPPYQFNSVMIDIDDKTNKSIHIERIQSYISN